MYLHIVSFDIPYPDNYGGVIVVFHQIRALHAEGAKVILHCFQYGQRQPQAELEKYCHAVYYYPRGRSFLAQIHWLPFIMRTRVNRKLIERLQQDDYPILCEGMHTSALLWEKSLRTRRKLVRMHNIEWQYYQSLARLTPASHLFKKLYYLVESAKLRLVEPKVVACADEILTLSANDQTYYRALKANTHYLAAFHPNDEIESQLGSGGYVLFHGKLSVLDNEQAAIWLIKEVFSKIAIPFVVAGMEPSMALGQLIGAYDHIQLVTNPEEGQMRELITNAHINLLVSSQTAGIKLKLLHALFQGRFCVTNEAMVSGTSLASLCYVRNSGTEILQTIEMLMAIPFEQDQIEARRAVLETEFSNQMNARKLIRILEPRSR